MDWDLNLQDFWRQMDMILFWWRGVNPAMVSNYVQYVIDAFLVSMAKRYDVN